MSTPCLNEEDALLYVAGAHSLADSDVSAHLVGCSSCREMVAEAARTDGAPASVATLESGNVLLDRYEIRGFVARGGMGEVYEAYDRGLKEVVALKTLVCHVLDDPRAASRLRGEVSLARRVTHNNVCRILEFGISRDKQGEPLPFLTMPFLTGQTLGSRLRAEGPLSPDKAMPLFLGLCEGLAAIHAAGIVHRDLKSDNIFLVPDAHAPSGVRPVIMDFGVARHVERAPHETALTVNGMVGTIDYMAPEQLDGATPNAAFDVYALGVVMFEALTGKRPFTGASPVAVAARRLTARAPRVSTVVPKARRFDWAIAGCLERVPKARFKSVEQVRAALSRPTDLRVWRWAATAVAATAALSVGVPAAARLLAPGKVPARSEQQMVTSQPVAPAAQPVVLPPPTITAPEPAAEAPAPATEIGARKPPRRARHGVKRHRKEAAMAAAPPVAEPSAPTAEVPRDIDALDMLAAPRRASHDDTRATVGETADQTAPASR